MVLHYDLISVSSEDEGAIAAFKEHSAAVLAIEGNSVCWISEPSNTLRKCIGSMSSPILNSFVREKRKRRERGLFSEFHYCFLRNAVSTSSEYNRKLLRCRLHHQGLPLPSPSPRLATLQGQIYFADGDHVNTKQTLLTNGQAHYIRFTTHGFYKTSSNQAQQVGIIAIILDGSNNSYGGVRYKRGRRRGGRRGLSFSPENSSTDISDRDHLFSSIILPSIDSPRPSMETDSSHEILLSPVPRLEGVSSSASSEFLLSPVPLPPSFVPPIPSTDENVAVFNANPAPKTLKHMASSPPPPINPYSTVDDDLSNKSHSALPPIRPSSRNEVSLPPLMAFRPLNLEDDSDEEEVLFTRNMITRLNNKFIAQGETPVPVAEEKTRKKKIAERISSASKERPDSGKKKEKERVGSATREGSAAKAKSIHEKEVLESAELEMVLKEMESFDGDSIDPALLDIDHDGGDIVADKRYYFRSRLAELHNIQRLLEQRKEEALDREKYSAAGGIDKCLKQLKLREEPLKELLVERMDALHKSDYDEAQKMKDKFELNMEAALDIPDLNKFISAKEMSRIRQEAKSKVRE